MTDRDKQMTLVEHLEELRQRLQYAVLGLLVATGVGLIYVDRLLAILLRPAGHVKLTTLTVLEPFLVKVKVAFLFGFAVSMPWILYQIYAFVDPALTETERRRTIPLSLLAGLLLLGHPPRQPALAAGAGGGPIQRLDHRQRVHFLRTLFPAHCGCHLRNAAGHPHTGPPWGRLPTEPAQGVAHRLHDHRGDRGLRDARLEPGDHAPRGGSHGHAVRVQHRALPHLHPANRPAACAGNLNDHQRVT